MWFILLIPSPLLLLSGSESWWGKLRTEDPTQYFQNARHVQLENAGHWVQHDQLDEFLRLTKDFFAEQ